MSGSGASADVYVKYGGHGLRLNLDDEQIMIKDAVRDFAVNELPLLLEGCGEDPLAFSRTLVKTSAPLGMMGLRIAPEYGGTCKDILGYLIALEELARVCPSAALLVGAHNSLVCSAISAFGNERQKERHLPSLASGKNMGALAVSEPDVGSDIEGVSTTAVREGGGFVLNGSKRLITGAGLAGLLLVLARTSHENDTSSGNAHSLFIVDACAEGVSSGLPEKLLGMRYAAVGELFFDGVQAPSEDVLGPVGGGVNAVRSVFNEWRLAVASIALGIGEAALETALEYASSREQFGRPLLEFQGVSFKLADMRIALDSARLMIYNAALAEDDSEYGLAAAIAKLSASGTAVMCASHAVQIWGGCGCCEDFPPAGLYRDAKVTEIIGGTSEVLRSFIAGCMKK